MFILMKYKTLFTAVENNTLYPTLFTAFLDHVNVILSGVRGAVLNYKTSVYTAYKQPFK